MDILDKIRDFLLSTHSGSIYFQEVTTQSNSGAELITSRPIAWKDLTPGLTKQNQQPLGSELTGLKGNDRT